MHLISLNPSININKKPLVMIQEKSKNFYHPFDDYESSI